jgi:hypothetical protein
MKKIIITFSTCLLAICFFDIASAKPVHTEVSLERQALLSPVELQEEDPVLDLLPLSKAPDQVTIKVFDSTGTLVQQKKVNMQELFQQSQLQHYLPEGSIFVYFSHQTAYYFLETPSHN